MKKFLFTIGMALFCGTAFAQNSAIFKAQALEQKGDIAGAAALLEEALKHPKTTKFAEMYHQVAEDNAKLFNPELMKACENGYGEGGTLGRIRSGTKLIKKDE